MSEGLHLPKIETKAAPVRTAVENAIRQQILRGALRPGQRLVERVICEETGASRAVVREALRQLQAEGLVSQIANRGAIVALLGREQANDIYDVRAVLEGHAAYSFALRHDEQDLRQLEAGLARLKSAAAEASVVQFIEAGIAFYDALLDGARNGELRRLLDSLVARIVLLRVKTISQDGRMIESVAELELIVDAVRRRDAEAAQEVSVDHIHRARDVALEALDDGLDINDVEYLAPE